MNQRALLLCILAQAMVLPVAAQAPALWIVDKVPAVAIGTAEGTADQELDRVSGARRLSDGRVVVANGKPRELRVFDVHGAFVSRIGRAGGGPGEFGGRLDLLNAGGDSILVYDQGTHRTMLFRPDGKLLQQWPASDSGSRRGATVLLHQSVALASPPRGMSCLASALEALPTLAIPAVRQVVPDDAGHYFVQLDFSAIWTVYNARGSTIGTARLPAGFDVYQFVGGYVVGRVLLEDGVEQVQVRRVTAPRATDAKPGCAATAGQPARPDSARADEFKRALRAALTSGEMAYANYATYVSTIDSLPGLKERLPANSVFRVLRSGNRGWSAILLDKRSTLACVFSAGDATLIGWVDAGVRCSQ